MRRLALLFSMLLASVLVSGAAAPAAAAVSVQIGLGFHDSLAPHGDWLHNERFGEVWAPRHLEHGWRPYTRGRWAYTDEDWTWVSDEEWGWATDHYGRWYFDPSDGWVWVPGDEWAPAWVAWRRGGGYVGWAPLPPDYDAFAGGADLRIDPFAYSFIPERHMLDRGAYREFEPAARNVTYLGLTQDSTHYQRTNDRIVNRGIDVVSVEKFTGQKVPRTHIEDASSAAQAHAARTLRGNVAVFRPRMAAGVPAGGPATGPAGRPAGGPGGPAGPAHGPGGPPPALPRPIAHTNVERPDQLARRQSQESQRLQSTEARERGQLQKIQAQEVKHPPVAAAPPPHPPQPQAQPEPRPNEKARPSVDAGQLRAQHEAEQKAQAEHEQREQAALQQRHQRETRAVAEAPKAQPPPPKPGKPAGPPPPPKPGNDKPGKDKPDKN